MRQLPENLQIGQAIRARITEIQPGGGLLLSFDGSLLRVVNESRRALKVGDTVVLIVRAVQPLRFQLQPERSEQRRRGQLDVSI